jgi:geranylgeranylglycerol-phosphate geranylgeranyltransferase
MNTRMATALASRAPLFSARFLHAYAVTMRPYLLFVSGITGVAGMALVPGVPPSAALVVGAAFFLSYGFGQALTDCFQMDTDSISAPWRPLVQAQVRRSHVLSVSLAGLVLVGAALTLANPWNLPLVAAMIAGLATYTRFKRIWWAGPPWNAWIVAAVCVSGLLAGTGLARAEAQGNVPGTLDRMAVAGTLVTVFFGYMNFVLAGYFKDVDADRRTGYRTMPVQLGRSASSIVSDALAVAAMAGALVAFASAPAPGGLPVRVVAASLLLAGAVCSFVAQVRLHEVRNDAAAHRAVVPVVHAYVLLLSGIAAAHRPGWSGALLAFVALYFAAIAMRPAREQV